MDWKKVKLGDVLQVKKGDYITKKEAKEGVYPVILGGKEPAYYIDRYNHTGKAIVISRSGASAGYVSFWNEPIFVTDGFLIEPKDGISFEFLYYNLKSKQYVLHKAQKGAAIPHVTPALISSIDTLLPSSKTQLRIASILSAYDNLIESNNKRIRLLEQMAENLYKEWFVRFRFPGHEKVEMENGLPKGWKVEKLGDWGISLESGGRPKGGIDDTLNNGVPSLGAEAIKGLAEYDYSSTKYVSAEFYNSMKRGKNSGNDILLYKDGAYIGRVTLFREGFPYDEYSINEHVFFIAPDNVKYQNYLYFTLRQDAFFTLMQNLNRNAAQPGLSRPDVERIKMVIPTESIIKKYNQNVEPILSCIFKMAKQNALLSRQRDLLLPRLMSGKLEVKE